MDYLNGGQLFVHLVRPRLPPPAHRGSVVTPCDPCCLFAHASPPVAIPCRAGYHARHRVAEQGADVLRGGRALHARRTRARALGATPCRTSVVPRSNPVAHTSCVPLRDAPSFGRTLCELADCARWVAGTSQARDRAPRFEAREHTLQPRRAHHVDRLRVRSCMLHAACCMLRHVVCCMLRVACCTTGTSR